MGDEGERERGTELIYNKPMYVLDKKCQKSW